MTRDATKKLPVARSGFDLVSIYSGDTGPCPVDLSDNTNLWGMSPSARKTLETFSYGEARRYPSAYSAELKESLARYTGTEPSMIVTGCGSDDVLDAAIRAFGNHKGTLACCTPTFSMIPVLARINGVDVVSCRFDSDADISVDQLLAPKPDIIYICSPNNPTAAPAGLDRIEAIASQFDGLVILDCAYAEYSATSLMPLLAGNSNVLITRTMSKAFGMAGLRVGYAIGHPDVVCEVEKSRGPYKVSAPATAAAIAAVDNDTAWIETIVAETLRNRAQLVARLEQLGRKPMSSDANFVLLPIADATAIASRMFDLGVAARAFPNLEGIGPALRITIGPWEMMDAFLSAFERSIS